MNLSELIKSLRGELNFLQFAEKTGVNRNTLAWLEEGKEVCKLSTLEQIARACGVKPKSEAWLDLMIGWIRASVGDENFALISVEKMGEPEVMQSGFGRLIHFFKLLSVDEQAQILKCVEPERKEVRNCLPSINQVWERLDGEQEQQEEWQRLDREQTSPAIYLAKEHQMDSAAEKPVSYKAKVKKPHVKDHSKGGKPLSPMD